MTGVHLKTWFVVMLALAAVSCKKNKKHYEETQRIDTLEVIGKDYTPAIPYLVYAGDGTYMTYTTPVFETIFRGELIDTFKATSEYVYGDVMIGETVDALFRREQNGGKSCHVDELFTSRGDTYADLGGSCTLSEAARGDLLNQPTASLERVSNHDEEEINDALDALPEYLKLLSHASKKQWDFALETLAEFLNGSPAISPEAAERFVNIVIDYLNNSPHVPAESLSRLSNSLAKYSDLLPNISPDFLQDLHDVSKLGPGSFPGSWDRDLGFVPRRCWMARPNAGWTLFCPVPKN